MIAKIKPDVLMTAKVETAREVKQYKKISCKQLFVVVETLNGVENIQEIAREMRKTDLFAVGYEDISAELMIDRPEKLDSLNPVSHIMLQSLIVARQHNIQMIDAVSGFFKTKQDLGKLKNECIYTAGLGMVGKVAIHPNQIRIINTIFKKKKKDMRERAFKIIEKLEKTTDGIHVGLDENNKMIDTPSYKMAHKIIK